MVNLNPRLSRNAFRVLIAAVAIAVVASSPSIAIAQDTPVLVGTVTRVIDGDTITVQLQSGPIKVRLDAIDAPESNQPGGTAATAALARLVANRSVELDVTTQDRYERLVAQVTVNGRSVNEQLVKDGHAWVFRRYARTKDSCVWEHAAREQRRGLWALPMKDWIYPSDWRRLRRHPTQSVEDFSHETVAHCIAALGQR